jgi:hypothetical protein
VVEDGVALVVEEPGPVRKKAGRSSGAASGRRQQERIWGGAVPIGQEESGAECSVGGGPRHLLFLSMIGTGGR